MHAFIFDGRKPERLDKAASARLGGVSREKVKKLIQAGLCFVDEQPCRDPAQKIHPGQNLRLSIPAEQSALQPETGEVRILWQDAHLLVIDKPAGLTVHPAPSCPQGTLVQRLLSQVPALREHEGWRPGIVHRLDKDTSGLILVAPDEAARLNLTKAFADREIHKTYLALVNGVLKESAGACTAPLGRHPSHKTKMAVVEGGRPAHTEWETLYADPDGRFSLLAVHLHTGRTHQIRVHMAFLGHPLLGDSTYAPRAIAALAPRQMLHAWKLAFVHPITGEPLSFSCPPPQDFSDCFATMSHRTVQIVITGLPGCGKSLLTSIMAEHGYPTWSADDAVLQSYRPGGDGWQALNYRYRGAYTPQGQPVDKAALAAAIRETPGMREEVEAMVHPIVNHDLKNFWTRAQEEGQALAFAEVPLWLESGGSRPKHGPNFGPVVLVGVDCPQVIRHHRLINSRHWAEAMVAAADSWQWPETRKMHACDIVIDNSSDEHTLRNKAEALISALQQRYRAQQPDLSLLLTRA